MFCPNCGTNNDDASFRCTRCGAALKEGAPQGPPPRTAYGPPPAPGPAYGPPPPAYAPQASYGAPPPMGMAANVPNHLVLAIVSTLCCCLPLGVVGIIYATQVNSKLAAGDVAGAMAASKNASLFSWIGIALGGLSWIVGIALNVLAVAAQGM